ncbi:hypothetical protein ACJW31_06G087300 [Castanea mollissima]
MGLQGSIMLNIHTTTIKAIRKLSSTQMNIIHKKKKKKKKTLCGGGFFFIIKKKKIQTFTCTLFTTKKNAFHAPQLLVIMLISKQPIPLQRTAGEKGGRRYT